MKTAGKMLQILTVVYLLSLAAYVGVWRFEDYAGEWVNVDCDFPKDGSTPRSLTLRIAKSAETDMWQIGLLVLGGTMLVGLSYGHGSLVEKQKRTQQSSGGDSSTSARAGFEPPQK